jgi:hypothetical protein
MTATTSPTETSRTTTPPPTTTTSTSPTTTAPTTPEATTEATTDRRRIALLGVCAALALNGLVLGPLWVLTDVATFSQTAALPAFAVSQRISWALLTVLVVLVPTLVRPGRRGTPPSWAVPLLQVALAAQAATSFVMGFVAPWLAEVAPQTLDVPGGTFQLATTVVWVAFIIVMVVIAAVLWRAGHSRVGAVLAAVGALAIPGVGPLGTGVLALGLGLAARGRRRGR